MAKKTLPVDVLKSLGVTDKPTGSSIAKQKDAGLVAKTEDQAVERAPQAASDGQQETKAPAKQGLPAAAGDKTKRLNIYLTEAQHQELRILSVTTGEPAYQICVDAMIKAGVISK